MLRAIGIRLLGLVPILAGIAVIVFFSIRLVPGDTVDVMLGDSYTPEVAAALRARLGLDQNVFIQFAIWCEGLVHGDFGVSTRSGLPVSSVIASHFFVTIRLALSSVLIAVVVAIPMGVMAARRPGRAFDVVSRILTVGGISMPSFVLAIGLILSFAVALHLLPSGGTAPAGSGLWINIQYLVLPALCLALEMMAVTMRMTRTSYLDAKQQDYVRTAKSKGLSEARIAVKHILRNSLMPVVATVGIQVGALLGGTVIVEKVFALPGLGSMLITAIQQRDYVVVQAGVILLAVIFVLVNLCADLLYLVLDPRLRDA